MIFVMAGNQKEAEDWMHKKNLRRGKDAIFLFRPDQLTGQCGIKYVQIGTWAGAKLVSNKRIMDLLILRKATRFCPVSFKKLKHIDPLPKKPTFQYEFIVHYTERYSRGLSGIAFAGSFKVMAKNKDEAKKLARPIARKKNGTVAKIEIV